MIVPRHPDRGSRILRAIVFLSFFVFLAMPVAADTLRVHFIDVGQGEAVLLETGSAAVLIDAGRNATAAEYIADQGIDHIDLAIATHAHADHIGGFPAVFERATVDRVWYNGQVHTTLTFERFLDAVLESGARYREPVRGDELRLGDLVIHVLHPGASAADYRGHLHDMNVVVRAVYGEFSVLITGDAETSAEMEILRHFGGDSGRAGSSSLLRSTILQLGHHGSFTSSSTAFLEAVSPAVVVYQAGINNQYGHPHDAVIERVRRVTGARVFGTDVHGSILFSSNQKIVDFSVVLER